MDYKEFIIRLATNEDIVSVKSIVFNVLVEYGLKPSESRKDIDLNDIEKNYFGKGGFFWVAIDTATNEIVGTFESMLKAGMYVSSEKCIF